MDGEDIPKFVAYVLNNLHLVECLDILQKKSRISVSDHVSEEDAQQSALEKLRDLRCGNDISKASVINKDILRS